MPDVGSYPQPGAVGYARFLWRSIAGVLVPGAGLIAAGRRRTGIVVLSIFIIGAAVAAFFAVRAGESGLVRLGTDHERINMIGYGLVGVATVWLIIAMISFYLLEPRGLRTSRRLLAALLVMAVASVVITPIGMGSHYAFTQRSFIRSVFPDDDKQHSLTIPEESTDEDPWAGKDRVNVLILGSDAGDGRDGVRTDTVMVASVETETGDTALFSLPRNLQRTPLPEGPLRDAYPDGYYGYPEAEYWLSSIYRNLPAEFPEYFDGVKDPGAEATKLAVGTALGLDIDYFIMVNLDGFKAIVDALGGIVLDVPYRIPMGTQATSWGTCTEPRDWIEEGKNQRLDGGEALWFARARCGPPPISDDYERMRRQRCVIGAIAEQADPLTLLTRYLKLESAVRDNITTDIGRRRLEDFAELALRVKDGEFRSLPFTDDLVQYYSPDFDLIRQFVHDSLDPANDRQADDGTGDDGTADDPTDEPTADETPGNEIGDELPDDDESDQPGESDGAQLIDDVC